MRISLSLLGFVLVLGTQAAAQPAAPAPVVRAVLNVTDLKPAGQAALAVVVDIPKGLHAQSHAPTAGNIPLELSLVLPAQIKARQPLYPPGQDVFYPKLGRLNVYTGRVVIYVPLEVSAEAKPPTLTLRGAVQYQMCDDATCFQPEEAPFTVTAVVAADQPVAAANAELFAGYDPALAATRAIATAPATGAAERAVGDAAVPAEAAGEPITAAEYLGMKQGPRWSYGLALGIAMLAGLLFNVMPCVLPVLPIKAIGFYETAQHNRLRSLLLGTVFSLGLIAVFAVLGGLILAGQLTWGQQFSKPWFTWGIVLILVVMALGLFGAFTVVLPQGIYSITPRHDTISGNFLFGVLTAILATPCTAPLLPAVLTFALSQPAALGALVVVTVGVGMALPYLLLSALPEVARRLPRSGPWPELFKQMMGFLVLGSAVYFGAGRAIAGPGFYWALVPVGVVAAGFVVWRAAQLAGGRLRPMAVSVLFAVVLGVGPIWLAMRMNRDNGAGDRTGVVWTSYSPRAFSEARQREQTVLVKFTANWCTTCQYVEATVFRDPAVIAALHQRGIKVMKADLTNANPPANALLRSLNKAGGIPLTAIYSSEAGRPVKIESVYEAQTLLAVLNKAAARGR